MAASPLQERCLLVLDLDETLLHAATTPLPWTPHWSYANYEVYERPGLEAFLRLVEAHFELAVWSSAGEDYVESLVAHFVAPRVPLSFVWSRPRCTMRRDFTYDTYVHTKDLRKLKRKGYRLERMLIVEDDPFKCAKNYGNAVYVPAFEGDPADDVLPRLGDYLVTLAEVENVRRIEKRGWDSAS